MNKYLRFCSIIISIQFIIISLCIVFTEPSTGYELSIYQTFSPVFYLAIITAFIFGFLGLVIGYLSKEKSNSIYIFLIGAIISIVILCLLPLLRGYAFYGRHDELTHIGMIKDILTSGYYGKDDFYPALHIIFGTIMMITGVDTFFPIRECMPLFFYILYAIFIALLVNRILGGKSILRVTLMLSLIPTIGMSLITFTPSDNMFFLVPLVLLTYYYRVIHTSIYFQIMFLITLIGIPFMHPELVALLIFSFSFIYIVNKMIYRNGHRELKIDFVSGPALILFIGFFTWFSVFTPFHYFEDKFVATLVGGIEGSPITKYSSLYSKANLSFVDSFSIIVFKYGSLFILVVIGLIFTYYSILKKTGNSDHARINILLSMAFIAALCLAIFSFINPTVIEFERTLKYLILITTIIFGIVLTRILLVRYTGKGYCKSLVSFCVIVILLLVSTFGLFPSPITGSYNIEVTHSELDGTGWFINYGNRSIEPIDSFVTIGRFVQFYEGYEYSSLHDTNYSKELYQVQRVPPDHFNYDKNSTLGSYYHSDKYLLINSIMKSFYLELWPVNARYSSHDFVNLSYDPSISHIYASHGFDVYYVIS